MEKFKLIKQHDEKDCGVACLSMILNTYGTKIPISKLRNMAGTNSQGTSALGLVCALETLGFESEVYQTDSTIWKEESLIFPFIAHVVIDKSFLHYVVIYGYKNGKILLADPAKGKLTKTPDEFGKEWTGIVLSTSPTPNYKAIRDSSHGLFHYLPLLKEQKKMIMAIIFLSLVLTGIGIVGSYYFQIIIDKIIPSNSINLLSIISISLLTIYITQAILQYIKQYFLIKLGQRLSSIIMLGYFRHVLRLPMNFFSTRKSGEIISRFLDATKVIDALANSTLSLFLDVSMLLIIGASLFIQNNLLFLISFTTVPIYTLIVYVFIKPFNQSNEEQLEAGAVLNSHIIESLKGIETIKSFNATDQIYSNIKDQFQDMMVKSLKKENLDNLQANLKMALQATSTTILLWIGTSLVLKGQLSIGQLITYNALMAYFTTPLQNIINLQVKIQAAKVANDRLNEIFYLEQEHLCEDSILSLSTSCMEKNLIDITNLSFAYGFEENVLNNISFSILPNEKIAIVGMSGSGKSTLAKLLVNFYETQSGTIHIHGIPIQEIPKATLRNSISYVSQETFFFSDSIYKNLIFGLELEPSMEEIIWACEIAMIREYIESLPLTYLSVIEEDASNLSGGQKQRLAIARALLKKSDIIIFDEATSGLDTHLEYAVIQNLMNLKNKTILFIAHQLSIAKGCDRIIVLENGKLVEFGTHDQLSVSKGTYEKLWRMLTIA